MRVRDAMNPDLELIAPEATIREAAERMRSFGIGALAVADGRNLLGFVTDRDLTVRGIARGCDPNFTLVREVMTQGVVTCFEDDPLQAAEDLMEERAIRRLVVTNAWHQPVGLVSLDDLARLPIATSRAAQVLERLNVP